MNKRNFIKAFLGFTVGAVLDLPKTANGDDLFEFQKQILKDTKEHRRCLFWMPRGSGKSFLYDYITGKDRYSSRGPRVISINGTDYFDDGGGYVDSYPLRLRQPRVVFATPWDGDIEAFQKNGKFDLIKKLTIYDLPIYDEQLLKHARLTVGEKIFRREFLCEFV